MALIIIQNSMGDTMTVYECPRKTSALTCAEGYNG